MDANKLRPGHKIVIDGEPYIVVSAQLRQQPRTVSKVIMKMKHLITGAVLEKTYTGDDYIDDADVANTAAQFLYAEGDTYHFMDNETFEQCEFPGDKIGEIKDFLKDGMEVHILRWNGDPINIDMPPTVIMEVIEAEPGVKGDSSTGKMKKAKLETGVEIDVPLFVEAGDKVVVNPHTREYRERTK